MTALFGGGRSAAQQQSKYLVEFRAGKLNFNSNDKMVTPDRRKGMIMIQQSDDNLMHFIWKVSRHPGPHGFITARFLTLCFPFRTAPTTASKMTSSSSPTTSSSSGCNNAPPAGSTSSNSR
jgi:hypothetical protein